MRRFGLSLLALLLPVGVLPAASAVGAPYDEGLSTPKEDSYYPAKGDPTVDALHYALDLDWRRRTRTLRGDARILIRAARDDSVIRLDLSRRLEVRRVEVAGARTGFTHTGHHLVIDREVEAGRRLRVRVVYRGTPGEAAGPASRPDVARTGMVVTRDGRLWTMQEPFGAFTWYPVNDHPSDKAMYDLRVSAPGRFVGVSNGRLVSRRMVAGRTVTRWTNSDPMAPYLVTLAVGRYERHRQTGPHGLPLTYWVPPNRPGLLKPLRRTPAALRWLEARLGRYPFDRAGVVVTPGGSAMETQTMVTFGVRNYDWGRFFVRAVLVHELAHQWYGDTVTPDDWRDLWMNEGMAMYLQERWEDAHSRRRSENLRREMRRWARYDQQLRDDYGPPGAYFKDEFGSSNVYYCAGLMWHRLRGKLGAATFDRLARRWPQAHRNSNQDRDDLVAWWEARTGRELSDFFDRWLDDPKSPA